MDLLRLEKVVMKKEGCFVVAATRRFDCSRVLERTVARCAGAGVASATLEFSRR